ncbi:hypothetical protein ONZ45_g5617 [Pleurotus djamor]|nr:hypothetical protein ONZ45_g5617 [Pleurotus djamor]
MAYVAVESDDRIEEGPEGLEFKSFLNADPSAPPQRSARVQGAGSADRGYLQDQPKGASGFWQIEYYQPYFDVDTKTASLDSNCFSAYATLLNPAPDLYGPFWTLTTLIFTLFLSSSLAASIATYLSPEPEYDYNFQLLSISVSLVYAYGIGLPVVLWVALRYLGVGEWSVIEAISIWGYGQFVWIPVSLLCVIPVPLLRWVLVAVAFGLSGYFLVVNVYPILAMAEAKATRLLIVVVAVLHAALALTLKVLFFSYYVSEAIGPDIPLPGSEAPDNSTSTIVEAIRRTLLPYAHMLDLHSHRVQLVAAAVTASLVTAGALTAYSNLTRKERRRNLNEEILRSVSNESSSQSLPDYSSSWKDAPSSAIPHEISLASNTTYDEELIREQLARNYAFFGEEGMAKIRGGSVAIVGCGGVGSWAAVMLVRSGISKIRLIDFDQVTLSSLNRHAAATLNDVGTPKVLCLERTLRQIAKWAEIDCRVDIWRKEEGGALLEGVDWVIDAIDNITTKVDLLKYCHDHNLKVFSSMGASAKSDPTRIQISDISYTIYDPLARSVRRRLRLLGVTSGIPVVYSTEVPGDVKLLPLPEEEFEKGPVKELGVFDDFRVRILPVIGPLPSIFGLNIATYILCELAGKPILNPLAIKNRRKLYDRLLRDLLHRESKMTGQTINKLPIDEDDVGLIFEDVYQGRSAIPPHLVPSRPVLTRWDVSQPLTPENCVVLDYNDAEKHLNACFVKNSDTVTPVHPRDIWGEEVNELVQKRSKEVSRQRAWAYSY